MCSTYRRRLYLLLGLLIWSGSSISKTISPNCWPKHNASPQGQHRSNSLIISKSCSSGTLQKSIGPVAERSVAVVKTVRTQRKHRIRICRDDAERKRAQKETIVEQGTNFYASNLELGGNPAVFVHQLGRSRWVIDTEMFQTITTDGHLKKPSVHQRRSQAFVVLTMIRVLA